MSSLHDRVELHQRLLDLTDRLAQVLEGRRAGVAGDHIALGDVPGPLESVPRDLQTTLGVDHGGMDLAQGQRVGLSRHGFGRRMFSTIAKVPSTALATTRANFTAG